MGLEFPLWRALAVYRLAALGYAVLVLLQGYRSYAHPAAGWLVLAVMAGWSTATGLLYGRPRWRGWPLLLADLVLTSGCLYASGWVITGSTLRGGAPTLTMAWVASPVLAWAIAGGRRRGALAALLVGTVDVLLRGGITGSSVNATVLLLLAGVIVGHVARLAVVTGQRLQRAVELEATTRERDRLARDIHDSVLQVLALVARRGAELGGEAAALGALAGEQGAILRSLVLAAGTRADPAGDGTGDLQALLNRYASATVFLAAPATTVVLPGPVAEQLSLAVASALDNVKVHCGPYGRAWILLEDEPAAVTVTVRDDGPGIPAGRLARAEADGRLGVAQSIRGRVRDIGGTVAIHATPGEGTEVVLRVPRPAGPHGGTGPRG